MVGSNTPWRALIMCFFRTTLNQNMPYIAIFKKSENLGILVAPPPDPRVVTHIYCLCNKTFKLRNSNVSTFILFKVNTIE